MPAPRPIRPLRRVLTSALAAVLPAAAALGHGPPVRLSVAGPEVIERPNRISTGGLGSRQDWAMVTGVEDQVSAVLADTIPAELAYLPGSASCQVVSTQTGIPLRTCAAFFTAPDLVQTEDVSLDLGETLVMTFSTTLAACPPLDGAGLARTCNQGTLTHSPPNPPMVELSDDFPTLATPDPTCLTFLACSTNAAPTLGGSLACSVMGDCQVQLDWPDANDPEGEPVSYRIYRGIGAGNVDLSAPIAERSAVTFVDTNVEPGIEYCYVIRATDGWNDSLESNECCATARDLSPPVVVSPLRITVTDCSVLVNYRLADTCTDIVTYQVHRDTTSPVIPGPGTLRAEQPFLPAVDSVPGDGIYHYAIVATMSTGETHESSEVTADVTGCLASFGEPLILAEPVGPDLMLSWPPIPRADGYAVYRGTVAALRGGGHDHDELANGCSLSAPELLVDDGAERTGVDHYYLAVVRRGAVEGTYGGDSLGSRRPRAISPCP